MRRWKALLMALGLLTAILVCGRKSQAIPETNRILSSTDTCRQEFSLTPDIQTEEAMQQNTKELQEAIDYAADHGGGTVTIPVGRYYFAPIANNFTDNSFIAASDREWHIISCRSLVTLRGAESSWDTVLYPMGEKDQPIDMFYFADLLETGAPTYLEQAEFENFTVDCRYAVNQGKYTAKGKGFYFVLLSDCHWRNVNVRNSDGTGFGVDCPIRCSMKGCEAVQCGKQAVDGKIGASGFGIGYGYSQDESIVLSECKAFNNRRFGFFIENQHRFRPDLYQTESREGFYVKNCMAGGNRYNFGGEYCKNLTYTDCRIMETGSGELFETKTLENYFFTDNCENCRVITESTFLNGTDYSPVYDFDEYIKRYPDIRAHYGNDPVKALRHFVTYGMKEGRTGRDRFVWTYYRHNYPDLQRAFGNHAESYYRHFLKYGLREGRLSDRVLPRADGIDYSPVYEEKDYKGRYEDLRRAFGEDSLRYFRHFLQYGMKEGRIGRETFQVSVYKNSYADLQKAFGEDLRAYYLHYIRYGCLEKRTKTR